MAETRPDGGPRKSAAVRETNADVTLVPVLRSIPVGFENARFASGALDEVEVRGLHEETL